MYEILRLACPQNKKIKSLGKKQHKELLLTWNKSNYIHYKVWGGITYLFTKFNSASIEIWEWISNLSHILLAMWLLICAGIEVNIFS